MDMNKLNVKNLKQRNLNLLCIYKSSVPQAQVCKLNLHEN